AVYETMRAKLHDVVPDVELRLKAPLVVEIQQLKRERNAVILGHNYMEPALYHTVPDFRGDSLELARRAAESTADVIVFCGVRFMAETAKILNPSRTVLLPTPKGGCSLAESITGADVRALKEKYPGVPVVCYINTSAEVKAECDVCCTSGNAAAIVRALGPGPVIFVPDEFLAGNVARETGREIIFPAVTPRAAATQNPRLTYEIVGWQGRCEVHEKFTAADRVRDGRQHRRRQPGQGDAPALQRALPAHGRDHAGADAGRAPPHALRDRRAGGDPRARPPLPRPDARDVRVAAGERRVAPREFWEQDAE
ncbi:MAG: quinolinate synthetase complex, subunit, partial [Acidobacteria bacterium]|nr:quinolinate synthetase complex, subunit [Acidobacteriota bacterium]